jgi:hypothetical protein
MYATGERLVVEVLSLSRQHLSPGLKERARLEDNPRAQAFRARNADGRSNVVLSWPLECWGGSLARADQFPKRRTFRKRIVNPKASESIPALCK